MNKKNCIKKNQQLPILLITPNTIYPSPLHKINRQIKNRAYMYQVALEVCFRVSIKLMFDMHVHMINCNNAYTGSLTNLHADKHTNNTDPQGHGCKSSCINKTGPQWNQTWSCLDCINMELWSKSPGSWIRSISESKIGRENPVLWCRSRWYSWKQYSRYMGGYILWILYSKLVWFQWLALNCLKTPHWNRILYEPQSTSICSVSLNI